MESEGWIKLVRDFPLFYDKELEEVVMYQDLKEDLLQQPLIFKSPRTKIPMPLHLYNRPNGKVGLMNSKEDSFALDGSEFIACVLNNKLGMEGFYLYALIKLKHKLIGFDNGGVAIRTDDFKLHTKHNKKTIKNLSDELSNMGLINTTMEHKENEKGLSYKLKSYKILSTKS
jgi:hypothetical protein